MQLNSKRRVVLGVLFLAWFSAVGVAKEVDFQNIFAPILATRHFAEVSISQDGQHVAWIETRVKNDTEYANTVYVADVQSHTPAVKVGPGDPRAQLGTSSIGWSPSNREFAYIVETGPERSEIRLASADGLRSRSLATLDAAVNTPRWSPDGKSIALIYSDTPGTREANPELTILGRSYVHQRIAVVDVSTGSIRLVSRPDLFVYEYDWSPDGRQMVVTAAPCCTDASGTGENNWWIAQLYRLTLDSGKEALLFRPQLQIASPKWSPDGSRIAFIGGLMSDFIAPGGDLFVVDSSGGQPRDVTPGLRASVTWLRWTNAEQLLTTEIVDGEGAIVLVHTNRSSAQTLWHGSDGPYDGGLVFAMSMARDGQTVGLVRQSFEEPPEVWAGPIGKWRQVSDSNSDTKAQVGTVESLHWMGDGTPVQGWLLYPRDYVPGRKYPLVVSVHGGPAAAALLHWPAAFDNVGVLSAFGYFVLYPNPRGSFGQGEAFTRGNVKNLGYGDLRDIEAGVKYATEKLPIDPRRIGITGWSYGGFMAMWAITQTDMFRASVAGPGVSDWESYYGQTEIANWLIPYFGASAYDDPVLYAKSSPIRFVKNVRAATLLYVGKEDQICPASQSFQLWSALKHFGVETELLLYSSEGHGINLPKDQQDIAERIFRWFERHLE